MTTWKYLFWIPYSKMPVYTHACVYKALCNWLSSTNNRSTGLCGSPLSRGLSLSLTQWWKVTWEEKLKTFVLSKQANHHPSEESFRLEGFGITGAWDNRRDWVYCPHGVPPLLVLDLWSRLNFSSKPWRTSTLNCHSLQKVERTLCCFQKKGKVLALAAHILRKEKSRKKENSF